MSRWYYIDDNATRRDIKKIIISEKARQCEAESFQCDLRRLGEVLRGLFYTTMKSTIKLTLKFRNYRMFIHIKVHMHNLSDATFFFDTSVAFIFAPPLLL